jgi:enolase
MAESDLVVKGVTKAIDIVVNTIQPKIKGIDVRHQKEIDSIMIELDGTENKSKIGSNAMLGVSIATARAAAASDSLHLYEYIDKKANLLPIPFFNVINGGKHAGNQLDFQEFMIAPIRAKNFSEALRMGAEVYLTLKTQLQKRYGKISITSAMKIPARSSSSLSTSKKSPPTELAGLYTW